MADVMTGLTDDAIETTWTVQDEAVDGDPDAADGDDGGGDADGTDGDDADGTDT